MLRDTNDKAWRIAAIECLKEVIQRCDIGLDCRGRRR